MAVISHPWMERCLGSFVAFYCSLFVTLDGEEAPTAAKKPGGVCWLGYAGWEAAARVMGQPGRDGYSNRRPRKMETGQGMGHAPTWAPSELQCSVRSN